MPVESGQQQKKLMEILDKAEDLPCLPSTALKVLKLCSNEAAHTEALEELLKTDQAITAKLLRTANSAFYGLGREITSLTEVIALLGIKGVKNVVMMTANNRVFNCIGREQLWSDSIEASLILAALFEKLQQENDETQFLTALLHNIGRSIFAKYFPEDYITILESKHKLEEIYEAEYNLFGMDHRETGGILACNWELPLNVTSGIQGNHSSMSNHNLIDLALRLTYSNLDEISSKAELQQFRQLKESCLLKVTEFCGTTLNKLQ